MKDLYNVSVTEQAKMVLSNIRGDENTAKKLEILIECHQLELGFRVYIFEEEAADSLDFLTETWLVHVIRRLREKKVRIKKYRKES